MNEHEGVHHYSKGHTQFILSDKNYSGAYTICIYYNNTNADISVRLNALNDTHVLIILCLNGNKILICLQVISFNSV